MHAAGRNLKQPVLTAVPMTDNDPREDVMVFRTDDDINPEYWHTLTLTRADLEAALAGLDAARNEP